MLVRRLKGNTREGKISTSPKCERPRKVFFAVVVVCLFFGEVSIEKSFYCKVTVLIKISESMNMLNIFTSVT